MKKDKAPETLVPEPVKLLKTRRGGAANVILTGLLLEAARMVDEGYDVPTIESAARTAFKIPKGFLAQMNEIGLHAAISYMFTLVDSSEPDDPFFRVYDNFFAPCESCKKILDKYNAAQDKSEVSWIDPAELDKPAQDYLVLGLLQKRFKAVAFMTAAEIVDAGIVKLLDTDKMCRTAFGWEEGPYAMMNRLGIQEAMQMVTEKMELSHRREINFPIPKLLITQAQRNEPWPLGPHRESSTD